MEANVAGTFKALFRAGEGQAGAFLSDSPPWRLVLHAYASAYERTSFFGTDSLHMNHAANAGYASEALNDGHLDMPVLFLEPE